MGNSGVAVSPVATMTTKGSSTPVVNTVCCAKAQSTTVRRVAWIVIAFKPMMRSRRLAGQKHQQQQNSKYPSPPFQGDTPATQREYRLSLLYRLRNL